MRRLVLGAAALLYALLGASPESEAAESPSRALSRQPPSTPPVTLTLIDAERLALANHPDIKVDRFDEYAAREAVKIARAGYEPQVLGTAVQAVAPGGTRIAAYNAITDPTTIQRTSFGVGIQQYVTDFGRTADLVQAAQFEVGARAADVDRTRDVVLLNVTQAYFAVLRANALLRVAEETLRERRTLLHLVETLQRAGLRSTLDVAIASRDVSAAQQLILVGRDRRLDAFAELTEAIGTADYSVYRLDDVRTLPAVPQDFTGLELLAERNNPDLAGARAADRVAASRVAAAGRLGSPTVTGYGFFGASPFRESNVAIPSPYAAAGVNLTVPIFTGGAIGAQQRQARDEAAAADAAATAVRNRLLRDVRIAFEDVKTARGNVDLAGRLLETADIALKDTDVRYKIGLNSIADVSEAELQRTQAAIGKTNALYDFIVQEASLEFATGMIASNVVPQSTNLRGS